MLSFFRRLTKSKIGIAITFVFLALIALAFAAGDVTGLGGGKGGMTATVAAHVGDTDVTEADLVARTQNSLKSYQQQQPTLDMAGFLAGGGLDGTLDQMINAAALEQFARDAGMAVSKRTVDGQIAGIPSLQGTDGKFSQATYDRVLAEQKLTDAQIRGDIVRETFAQLLTAPTIGATQVPVQLATPYAALQLERRKGQVAFLPAAALPAAAAPTDAEVQAWYQRSLSRYSVPERRVIRYALVSADSVKAQSTPTDTELAAAYQENAARYAPTEKRTLEIATALDQATATAIANRVKGGATLTAAAQAAGLEARLVPPVDKPTLAKQVSTPLADAAFAAAPNALNGPTRISGSWLIFRVTKIDRVAGKTLADARAELATEVSLRKAADALGKLNDALDSSASEGATFDELVADKKLKAETTPALLVNGRDPLNPAFTPAPVLQPILQAGFAAEQGDSPQIVQTGPDGSFALVALGNVVAAAPRPLAEIRAVVASDFAADRAQKAARALANKVVDAVNKGTPLAAALAATKVTVPRIRQVDAARAQIANPQGAEPSLALMFSMAPKKAKLLEAPNRAGWLVVYLDSIQPGDVRTAPQAVVGTRAGLSRVVGREYVEQFGRAVRNAVGVRKNDTGINRARAQLSGQTPEAQP